MSSLIWYLHEVAVPRSVDQLDAQIASMRGNAGKDDDSLAERMKQCIRLLGLGICQPSDWL